MPRPERPLDDPNAPVAEFAAGLRGLREQAGNPAYRSLARRANFSAATLAAAASGRRLPTLPVTLAYVEACGGDTEQWAARWRTIAAQVAPERPGGAGDDDPAGRASAQERPPYVGLAAFQPDDAELFFGRRRVVDDLVRRLRQRRLVVVFGPSGVGKSSVVRAGLLPAARAGLLSEAASDEDDTVRSGAWPIVLMVPGARPLTELALRLATLARVPAGALRADLSADPARAGLAVRQALGDEPADTELLLVVDQFEGVFATDVESAERAGFVAALVALCTAADSRARVVLAVRADHYPRFVEHPELLAAMTDGHLLVGGMSPAELRDAVVKPAERVGARVESTLVSAIVAEVASRPGALPLASHALLGAWQRRRGTTVTLSGYEAAGGVDGAVAATAEGVYGTFDDEQCRVLRRLLLRLVDVDQAGVVQRRRAPRSEFSSTAEETLVVDRLTDARLLTTDRDSVELAHESLIRAWPRLRGWVEEDLAGLRIHRRLTDAADGWESVGRDEGALYRGTRLAVATEWYERRLEALTATEQEFLDASVRLGRREAAAARRRKLVAWTGSVLASVLLAVLSVVALVQADRATAERDRAVAWQLSADARAQRREDPELALLLALRAYTLSPDAETESVLRQATADARNIRTFRGHQGLLTDVAFSPDGRHIASSDPGRVTVRDPAGRGAPTAREWRAVSALAFSPDGTRIAVLRATESDPRIARLTVWTVASGDEVTLDTPLSDWASHVVFSPDGRSVAVGDVAGVVKIVDLAGGRPRAVLSRTPGPVSALTFTPNGGVASITAHGSMTSWDPARPDRPSRTAEVGRLTSSSFSADGRRVAVSDGRQVWTAATTDPARRVTLRGGEYAENVVLSPDGQQVAATRDRAIVVWDLSNPSRALQLHSPHPVSELAFSPDGSQLVSGGTDAAVRVWNVSAGLPAAGEAADGTRPVAMSADGRVLAASAAGGTVRVHRAGNDPAVVLRGAPAGAHELLMSANGRTVAAVSGRSPEVSVWNVDGDGRPRLLRGVCGGAGDPPGEMELSPSGRWAAVSCADESQVWDLAGVPRLARSLPHGAPFAFSPDERLLAAGGTYAVARAVAVWRLADGTAIFSATTSDSLARLAFGPDNDHLAVQACDGSFQVHRVHGTSNGHNPTVLAGLPTQAVPIAFSPDGRLVATTTSDDTVRVQNVDGTGEPIVLDRSGPPIVSLRFAPGGRDLITLHGDATARHLPCEACGPIAAVAAIARQRITRDFSAEERLKYLHAAE